MLLAPAGPARRARLRSLREALLREALLREGAALGAKPLHHGVDERILGQLRALGHAEGASAERR